MGKILFVVHGMGSHPPGWAQDIRDKLDQVASAYAAFKQSAFSRQVQIIEIRYDGVFEQYIEQWQADADKLAQWSADEKAPLPKIVAWLKKPLPPDEEAAKNFMWATALDPVLYRGFSLVRDQVRATVIAQIVSGLTKNMVGGAVEASVLAHSLGTAVTHDALATLGKEPYQGNESFAAARFAFESIFMLADVCQLGPAALRDIDPLGSVVKPTSAGAAGSTYCQTFLNATHRWDPFVLCGPFTPANWGAGYLPIGPLEHFHQANVHGFTHYIDHPAVHVPIINGTLGYPAVTVKEEQDAIAKYPAILNQACSSEIKMLKQKADDVAQNSGDLETLAIKIAEFFAVAKKAAASCKELANV